MAQPGEMTRYGSVSQAFHWITVVLVIVLLLTGLVGHPEAEEPGNATFMWHGSLGVLVFVLAIARVIWRLGHTVPALPPTMTRASRAFARAVHIAFYVLLFALPITGWLVASAEGAAVNFFGVASLPRWEWEAAPAAAGAGDEVEDEAAEQREHFFEEVHEVLGYAILALAILHLLAALKHHFVDRDDVLRSMLPGAKRP